MPAPTKIYKLVMTHLTMVESKYTADLAQVNDLASQGYDVTDMVEIGGGSQPIGFVFLMSRTVTAMAEETDGRTD
jgi:hypothetical protein